MQTRGGGSSTAALVVMMLLAGLLACISKSKTRDDLLSTMQSISRLVTLPEVTCQSSSISSIDGVQAPAGPN